MRDNVVRYTHACDMFSLGVIFHFLLLGISPFSGTSMEEIIWKNKRCIIDFFDSIYR
jgi:serine/threonine protein kinase